MKTITQKLFKIALLCSIFFTLFSAQAQAPQKMSYQAVVRNTANTLISNTAVGVKISVLQTSVSGTVVYAERHTPTTNANGLATFEIGGGTVLTGTIAGINWATGPYFIKTETDPTGGTNYTISGTSQLASVPYALFAANGGTPGPQGIQGVAGAIGAQGVAGVAGTAGINGKNTLILTTTEPVGANCATGGTRQQYGLDNNGNNVLDPSEINASLTKYVCNGLVGATGAQGIPGTATNAWGLSGNTGSATNFIGTTDNTSLTLKTNNTQAMIIEPNGYTVLGSGVVGPIIDRFGIEGNALMIGAPVSNLDNGTLKIRNRGQVLQQLEDQQMNLDGEIIQTTRIDDQGSYAADLKINPNGGNIGIGNTGTIQNKLQIGNPPGFSGNDIAIGNGTQAMSLFQSPTASIFYTNTNFAFMPASGVGNMGIGTTTPTAKLDVQGDISSTSDLGNKVEIKNGAIYTTPTGNFNLVPIGVFNIEFRIDNDGNLIDNQIRNIVGNVIAPQTLVYNTFTGFNDFSALTIDIDFGATLPYTKIVIVGAPSISQFSTWLTGRFTYDEEVGIGSTVRINLESDNFDGGLINGTYIAYGIKQ
ncbi:hypothetical protein [Flavobacterium sp.]|uniref:DUF7151 family protein n=1 Tax=Flavobacterium sp. TaxID=239 RepID=UPI003752AD58